MSIAPRETANPKNEFSFGPFRLAPAERLLEKAGTPVQLGGRALDILIVLLERAGEVVSKQDLIRQVWPDVTVDEGSLRFHISVLRKALGDGETGARYVTNVPGRGYSFVEPVRYSTSPRRAANDGPTFSQYHRLPSRLMRMVGRDDIVQAVASRILDQRFVTIVGPGGIGKTTVAVSVAHALIDEFEGAVRFIDLGALNDPRLVASNLASALGLPVGSDNAIPTLIEHLRKKRMLLVFDSCEHVIEAAAALSETIFIETPHVHILATSREPLRVEGEQTHRLFPLDYPPEDVKLTALEALDFPAVQLFVERVAASTQQTSLSDEDARSVAEICRKLDGIALAIELAAGRVAVYGIQGTAALLDDRLTLLKQGRRTAAPRHQTLNATLDWSHNLLPELERIVLRRLSVFVGSFSLQAAQAVAFKDRIQNATIIEAVALLVEKSLISTVLDGGTIRYRLLDTTRAYAKNKLLESGELNAIARCHAEYCRTSLEADSAGLTQWIRPEQTARYADQIGNIRSALEWCFSLEGASDIGVALAAAANPVFLSMSLWQECQRWTERAIGVLDASSLGTRRELSLQTGLGMSLLARHDIRDTARVALTRALTIAGDLGDVPRQLRLLSELRVIAMLLEDVHGALALAQRSKAIADTTGNLLAVTLAEAELGMTLFVVGNQAEAQRHCEEALRHATVITDDRLGHYENDILVQTRCALASILWLLGFSDQAGALAKQIIDDLDAADDFMLLSNSLLWIIPVFLWRGDWSTAERLIDLLTKNAQEHDLGMIEHIAGGLRGQLLIGRGEENAGVLLIEKCQANLKIKAYQISNLMSLALGLAATGDFENALMSIDQIIPDGERFWGSELTAEMLRIKGDILIRAPETAPERAEQYLLESAAIARHQSALSWELRTATSLAGLWVRLDRHDEARTMLGSVYERFTEGFNTHDLVAAKRLLNELS